jgi:hypothetical protein
MSRALSVQMTQLGRHSTREDFRNRVANLRIAAALTISVSRTLRRTVPRTVWSGLPRKSLIGRSLPQMRHFRLCSHCSCSCCFTYGVLQPIRNLLRFLKIHSEVFRSRTLGEPFDGAQRKRGCLPSFPTHSTMMFQRMFPPGWSQVPANHKGGISVKTPRFFPVPI